jgi:hypothetical protein
MKMSSIKDFLFNRKFGLFKISDFIVFALVIIFSFLLYSKEAQSIKAERATNRLIVEISVPNLEPEVADQINISDRIIDKDGNNIFEITEKVEKSAEHPTIDKDGNIKVAKHPKLVSLFLNLRTVNPQKYENGIKYNWQVVKIGGSLIWETKYSRFVGLVRNISEEEK